jgi:ATP-dependent exoDNAse (exonuclease V) beta subunit
VQLAHENAQMSLSEFVQSLQSMREFRVKQTAAPLDSENAVKLMTIHSSKGLEFPIVALPKLDTKAFEFKGKLHFHREYGLSFDSTRGEKEEKPAHFLVAKRIETDMEIAESKRLLYVAMTRARDYLGLFFDEREESSESFKTWIQEFFREHPADTSATCLELRTDRQTIFNPALISEAAVDAGKAQIQPAINLDLITDLSAANIPPRPRWQSLLRVTPSASLPEIEPTVLGDCFHKVMEYFCESLRLPDADTLKAVLESDGIAVVHPQLSQLLLTELKRLLQLFEGSDLQALMQDSKLRLAETPYVLLTEDSPVVSKRPDLLLQDCLEQWHVIDYKTDHIAEAEMAHQAEEHRKQLSTYRHDIELLAGVKPAAAVYFAQLGRLHRL